MKISTRYHSSQEGIPPSNQNSTQFISAPLPNPTVAGRTRPFFKIIKCQQFLSNSKVLVVIYRRNPNISNVSLILNNSDCELQNK